MITFDILTLYIVYKRVIFVDPITAVGSKPPATTRYHMYARSSTLFSDQVGRQLI